MQTPYFPVMDWPAEDRQSDLPWYLHEEFNSKRALWLLGHRRELISDMKQRAPQATSRPPYIFYIFFIYFLRDLLDSSN